MPYKPPKIPPKPPNSDHWKGGRKWPPWKDENRVWNKRKGGLRQKPWNKVTRIEKFWTVNPELPSQLPPYTVQTNSPNAQYVVGLTGQLLASDQNATEFPRALQHVKLHKFQGAIWAWLNPADHFEEENSWTGTNGPGGLTPSANIGMLSYAWFKLKEDANVPGPGTVINVANYNIRPNQDMADMLLRDDIISWGTVPVFGISPFNFTPLVHTNATAGVAAGISAMITEAGVYRQNHVAKVPFPRLPKTGMNLRKGEALMCAVAAWMGPGAVDGNPVTTEDASREVQVFPLYRMLCSI